MIRIRALAAVVIAGLVVVVQGPAVAADDGDRGWTMRVETELFAQGASEPAARSLTLFRNGVAWDFLELPVVGDEEQGQQMQLAEIVLHDPARERLVVIGPVRNVKTQVEAGKIERLSVPLATWAPTTGSSAGPAAPTSPAASPKKIVRSNWPARGCGTS